MKSILSKIYSLFRAVSGLLTFNKILAIRAQPGAQPSALPQYMTVGASGMDVYAAIDTPITVRPMSRVLIPIGWRFAIPHGFELQLRPRSGLAYRSGITCITGTIDSDYRGEVHVLLFNISDEPFIVNPGTRIAQMVCMTVQKAELLPSYELPETTRGSGGFGSTGDR